MMYVHVGASYNTYSPINCDASSSRKSLMVILDLLAVWCFISIKALVMATSSKK